MFIVILLLITTCWMGVIGFIDDYIKKFKNDKEGLKGRFKILGQVGLGIIVGATLYFNENVTIKEKLPLSQQQELIASNPNISSFKLFKNEEKSTKTTIPFVKGNEFDYASLSYLDKSKTQALFMGYIHFSCHFHYYGRIKRSQSD